MEKDELLSEAQLVLYKQALITIAWCIPPAPKGQNARRRLVFASVELIPKYWGEEYGNKEDSVRTRNPNCRYYYRRWKTCVDDALEWYKSIHQKRILNLPDETETQVYLFPEGVENVLVETPAYPYLATSIDSPIVPSNWGAVRLSHLTPHNIDKDSLLLELMNDETIFEWFNSRLMFDLNENIDYLSSVNLIAPNPYYCRSFLKLDSRNDSNKESVVFSLDNYRGDDSLQLICCESINDELSNLKTYHINQNPINIPLLKTGDKFCYAVFTQNNDLIDYSGFNSFVRKICFNIRMSAVTDRRDIVDERVEPHIADIILIERQLDAPGEAGLRTRDAEVFQRLAEESERLVGAERRLDEVRVLGDVLDEPAAPAAQSPDTPPRSASPKCRRRSAW